MTARSTCGIRAHGIRLCAQFALLLCLLAPFTARAAIFQNHWTTSANPLVTTNRIATNGASTTKFLSFDGTTVGWFTVVSSATNNSVYVDGALITAPNLDSDTNILWEVRNSTNLVGIVTNVSSSQIIDSTIVSADVLDGTLTAGDLGTDSVNADELNATGVEAELESALDIAGEVTSTGMASTVIGDSITVATWTMTGAPGLALNNGATSSGELRIFEDTDAGANYTAFLVPALAANISYTLPPDDGDAGEVLSTDGAGVLTWVADQTGAGGGDPVLINGTAVGDAAGVSLTNTVASSTVTPVTWALDTATTPDLATAAIGNASGTAAGALTAGTQTLGGDKTLLGSLAVTNAITAQNVSATNQLSVGTSGTGTFDIGSAGVRLTDDGDGALTLLGLGDGSDESLTLNFDDVANTVGVSSTTGVGTISFASIGLTASVFTGPLSGNADTASATISAAGDPADAGVVRLGNAEVIAWEASPAGTDVTLTVNTSEVFVFSNDATVPDEIYDATAWNGSLEVPTKNAVRDQIETMLAAGGDPVLVGGSAVGDAAGVDLIGGTGVDIALGTGTSPDTATFTLDLTELQSGATFGDGSAASFVITANIDAVDPTLEFRDTGEIVASQGATASGAFAMTEDTDNGTSILRLTIASALAAERTITFRDASGTPVISGDTFTGDVTATLDTDGSTVLTIAANSVALTTDTTGNYVLDVADGTGIDGTAAAEGATYTPTLDLTEINNVTWGDGSLATITNTYNVSTGTDPILHYGNNLVELRTGNFRVQSMTASKAAYTDASTNLVSVAETLHSWDISIESWQTNGLAVPAALLAWTNGLVPWSFADAVTNTIAHRFSLPTNWNSGTVVMMLKAGSTTTNNTTSTNAVWGVRATTISETLEDVPTWGTEITVTNHIHRSPYRSTVCLTAPLTIGNTPGPNKDVIWQIRRVSTDATDVNTNTLSLLNVTLFWLRSTTPVTTLPAATN